MNCPAMSASASSSRSYSTFRPRPLLPQTSHDSQRSVLQYSRSPSEVFATSPLRLLGKHSLPLRAVVTSKSISSSSAVVSGDEKIGVLLLNLGGPETLDDVQPFLFNLFADPDIIRLPPLFQFLQKPLAQFISVARAPKSKEGYASIGGGSPLRHITDAQAEELSKCLSEKNVPAKVYVGMRYWHPFTEEAIEQIKTDGITKLVVLPLYPQFSISTSGSSLRLLERIFREDEYLVNMQHTVIPSWYQREGYIKAMANLIQNELGKFDFPSQVVIFFSAHGVPLAYVEEAGDPYKAEMEECVDLIMEELDKRSITNAYTLAYQSRVGPVEWLKPYTEEAITELGKKGVENLLAVPISFVSEHIETLEEIDVEYKELALKSGIKNWGRVPALGTEPLFISDLADAVVESLPYVGAMAVSNLEARQSLVPLGSVEELLATYDSQRRELPAPVTMWEWGWTRSAETWNGRAAMLAVLALLIFKLDFQSDDRDLTLVGEIPSSERFHRLAWGKNGSGSEQFSLGLIAGGLVDGNIDLWNPLSLIGSQSALVGHLSVHKGPVRGLEFNAIAPNLLASAADDGEICIWDLAKPSEPSHFPLLKGSGSATQGEISFISWNRKVQQILASTSYNGTTAIWDLRKQKPIINFADSVRRRCSVLQWNPDIATQIMVASDDDSSPTLKLWDMRNTMSPVREFTGHQKGVIAMEWCPSDSSYLLTCAKDNRTICWDTNTAEIVAELPAGNNWNFDVHWYPKIPGVISASSFDGKIGIYNIEGCSRYGAEENNFSTAPLRAPKWYKRPVGASFGFGGKLVSFHAKAPPKGASNIPSEVFLHSLVTEQSLVSRTSEFEAAIENGDKTSLKGLCGKKSEETESEEEKETWGLLKIMFEEEGTTREKLISHLGFSLPSVEKDHAVDGLSSDLNDIGLEDSAPEPVKINEAAAFAMDNGEDFFDNFPSKPDTPVSTSSKDFMPPDTDSSAKVEETQEIPEEEEEEGSDKVFDDAIQRALVVGNYNEAVDQCISANKMADALVIAHVGGTALWESTREKYLKTSGAPYMKIVSAMVNNDLTSLIYTRSLKFWKETLALLCTFAQGEQWASLCDVLASKLMAAGNTLAAVFCYICAGNVDRTVEIWSRSLANERNGRSYAELLQDLMEKTLVLALATGNKKFSASLCKLFESYAEILASQGLLTTAMKYLKVLDSGGLSLELSILRDRISLSAEPETNAAASGTQLQSTIPYNQEPTQAQPNVLSNPYDNQYQQAYTDSYGGGYVPSASHATMQQATMFMPHQAQPAPQPSYPPAPASNAQPSMRTTFVPSTPPALKNADQYQQPAVGFHSFTGPSNNAYPVPPAPNSYVPPGPSQVGQNLNPMMPQAVAPGAGAIGFTPMSAPGVAPRSVIGSVQPASPPTQQPTPAAPPPTVQTADTSNVPAHQKPVVATLTRLFNETSEALGGARANPSKKREIEDNSRKLGALFVKLNSGDISKNAADKLAQLCHALDTHDFGAALQLQVLLTTSEWDECNFWLSTLKRMIKARQSVR
ncbi:unnamed protein product [Brassica oleracea]